VNQRIAAYSDDQWDASLNLLARLTPAQAAAAIRGDFSLRLIFGILRRNPDLLQRGARSFANTIVQRLGRAKPVTPAEVAATLDV
jgi:digeranylgeranylglycerophospholipid reductase